MWSKRWEKSWRKSATAGHSKIICCSSHSREGQCGQWRRYRGKLRRLPWILGKEWQPHRNLKNCVSFLRGSLRSKAEACGTPDERANHLSYVHREAPWEGHDLGHMCTSANGSCTAVCKWSVRADMSIYGKSAEAGANLCLVLNLTLKYAKNPNASDWHEK